MSNTRLQTQQRKAVIAFFDMKEDTFISDEDLSYYLSDMRGWPTTQEKPQCVTHTQPCVVCLNNHYNLLDKGDGYRVCLTCELEED